MMLKTLNHTLGVFVEFSVWIAVLMLGILVAVGVLNLCLAGGSTALHLMHS